MTSALVDIPNMHYPCELPATSLFSFWQLRALYGKYDREGRVSAVSPRRVVRVEITR